MQKHSGSETQVYLLPLTANKIFWEELKIVLQDLRFAFRMFVKQPAFTFIAILTLALGIGATSAIFSVVYGVLLRPLSLPDPDKVVNLWEARFESSQGITFQGSVSAPNYFDWREQNEVFTGLSAYQFTNLSLQTAEQPERIRGAMVSSEFFDVLGVQPLKGRIFLQGEDQQGKNHVAILSYQLWQRNFAADPDIVNKEIILGGETHTIIGVMPATFGFPSRFTEIWIPLIIPPDLAANRGYHYLLTIARLKDGVMLEQAQDHLKAIARGIEEKYPNEQTGRSILVIQAQEQLVQNIRPALLMLLGAVGLVLLIACTNVANLLLARATARTREIAIRTALGASRFRLIAQFLTESVLLSLMGGALGLLLAYWGVDVLLNLATNFLPRVNEVSLDWRVIVFTLGISIVTGILFGLAPALQISKPNIQSFLKEGGSSGHSPHRNWLRSTFVVSEIALSLMLLVGAGLLIKSFSYLLEIDSGMKPDNVLTMGIALPQAKYSTQQTAAAFHRQILERLAALPTVNSVGIINMLPIQQTGNNGSFEIEGKPPYPVGQEPIAEKRSIIGDYFKALGIAVAEGRTFTSQDQEKSTPVVMVNKTFVKKFMDSDSVVGKRINVGDNVDWRVIVGVVEDIRQNGITREPMPEIYVPINQSGFPINSISLVVQTTTNPTALTSAIRHEIQAIDPMQPIHNVKTMEEVISDSVAGNRLNMTLLTIFAGLAIILAVIGIYSVMSYTVTQSTKEIGIRLALGADTLNVLKLVLGQGFVLTLIGIAIGIAGAYALTGLMSGLLFGVKATDPVVFIAVSVILIIVALAACLVPARRAIKVDPIIALRYE
ncbi:MAG: ABC transporter permease [Acidobacteriota bacterium]